MFKTHRPSLNSTNGTDIDRNYFINLFDGVISMHMMALNEFGSVFDELDSTDYPKLAKLLFCVYMIIVSILLINMLIAMLGKTYQDIASQPNESLRQWARALLIVERLWTSKERLAMLDRYSHERSLSNGAKGRYYGSTWALTVSVSTNHFSNSIIAQIKANSIFYPNLTPKAKDRQEIDLLKKLNTENKKNALRLAKAA